MTMIYDEVFPLKVKKLHYKSITKPWITDELLRQIKKKNKLFSKKSKSSNRSTNEKYRKIKKEVSDKLKMAKKEYYQKKL